MKPINITIMDKHLIKKIEKYLKLAFTTNICDGELNLEKMQLNRLEKNMEDYALWIEYRDQMELQNIS
jgi:hypothetical protein